MKLKNLVFLFGCIHCACGRGGRGRSRGRGGGFVDPSLLDPWSWLPSTKKLDMAWNKMQIEQLFRSIKKRTTETNYGTKFGENENISHKAFGLGVGPSFIGGAGLGLLEPNFGFVAGLVSFSVYHRYIFFKRLLHQKHFLPHWDSQYYDSYYEK